MLLQTEQFFTVIVISNLRHANKQRWSPRGRGFDLEAPPGRQLSALALALKAKSLALVLASEPKCLALALASAFSLAYMIKEQGIKRTVMDSVQRND